MHFLLEALLFALLRFTIGTLDLSKQMTPTFIFLQNKEMSFLQALLMDGLLGTSHLLLFDWFSFHLKILMRAEELNISDLQMDGLKDFLRLTTYS